MAHGVVLSIALVFLFAGLAGIWVRRWPDFPLAAAGIAIYAAAGGDWAAANPMLGAALAATGAGWALEAMTRVPQKPPSPYGLAGAFLAGAMGLVLAGWPAAAAGALIGGVSGEMMASAVNESRSHRSSPTDPLKLWAVIAVKTLLMLALGVAFVARAT